MLSGTKVNQSAATTQTPRKEWTYSETKSGNSLVLLSESSKIVDDLGQLGYQQIHGVSH
jgi:hypothetical protein